MNAESPFAVRPARDPDSREIVQFLQPFANDRAILPRTTAEITALMQNGFVAVVAEKIIGCAAVEIYSQKLAEIQCLAVDQAQQRQGVGRALVEACIAWAGQLGVREVMAITASDSLFLNSGFKYGLPGQKKALFHQIADEIPLSDKKEMP
jgi:amino-acid N-acetyltransferase